MGRSFKDQARFEILDNLALERYKKGESLSSIAKNLEVKREALTKRLKDKFNITVNRDGKKNIDSYYFSTPTHENMYWIGFILADGSMDKNNGLEIGIKDKEHIEKFKLCLKSGHKISEKIIKGKSYWRINIRDTQIAKDLNQYGVVNNKSNIDIGMPTIPDKFFGDFLRGFFDGDGSLAYYYKREYHRKLTFTIGYTNRRLANQLLEKLKQYDIELSLYEAKTSLSLETTNKATITKLVKLMYKDATIYLDRKLERVKEFLPS